VKGNEWYFGMKGHIGVSSQSKLIHSVAATAMSLPSRHPRAKDFTNKKGARNRPLSTEDKATRRWRAITQPSHESGRKSSAFQTIKCVITKLLEHR